jgi:hypothetical protein
MAKKRVPRNGLLVDVPPLTPGYPAELVGTPDRPGPVLSPNPMAYLHTDHKQV